MSFIRHKVFNDRKYAYEVSSFWDPKLKKVRQKTNYLGIVNEKGQISKKKLKQEKLQLDFGDLFLLHEFTKKQPIYNILQKSFAGKFQELLSLLFFRLCVSSAMYNAENWFEGNVARIFFNKTDLRSQNISKFLKFLGKESIQREFFASYLKESADTERAIIIDATSLPNESSLAFNAWGYSEGEFIKQLRLLCVIDQKNQTPLFYRYIPGNISDVSTLQQTIAELQALGVKNTFVLLDSGYFSKTNILELYEKQIDFLSRLPCSRKLYKQLIHENATDLENLKNSSRHVKRGLFVKKVPVNLYEQKAFAYLVLDPVRKGKEIQEILLESSDPEIDKHQLEFRMKNCGIMILITSLELDKDEVVSHYYMRQSVEQVFGFFKSDLQLLPLRRHSDEAIRGYLFLQFLCLILFLRLRKVLLKKYTVEQALFITRNLKCKVFDDTLLIVELTKQQKEIYKLCDIIVPKKCGI